ncbi:hypothetical protein [Catellatospora methionotrophica]|nr:hypothetical protein [Catellatospora methionotrophica]
MSGSDTGPRPGLKRSGRRAWAVLAFVVALVALAFPALQAASDSATPAPAVSGTAAPAAEHQHMPPPDPVNLTFTWLAVLLIIGLVAMLVWRPPPRSDNGGASWRYTDPRGQERNAEDAPSAIDR